MQSALFVSGWDRKRASRRFPYLCGRHSYQQNNDEQEATTATFEYGPFGELIAASGPDQDRHRFRFSTKYEDPATGYLYYGFRYYDPVTGRWPSRDPIGKEGALSLYSFIFNDGINDVDVLGLKSLDEIEEQYRYLIADAKSKGYNVAAGNLDCISWGQQGKQELWIGNGYVNLKAFKRRKVPIKIGLSKP